MKKRSSLVALLLIMALAGNGQVPQKFNYQAVVRDAQHEVISKQDVGFKLSILAGSTDGPPVYVETHTVPTSAVGLANMVIGDGTVQSGVFKDIDWGADDYFLEVAADPAGGSAYEYLGTSQLISVPYALYSGNISSPTRKFTVQEEMGHPVDSALFEVRNKEGQTVFAVYPEGTRIYVLDEEGKGVRGGFAIGGYSRNTKGVTHEYMWVTPDSIRMYFDEKASKSAKGGFAIGGYSRNTKGPTDRYFELSPDSARFTLISNGDVSRANALSVVTKPKGDPGASGNSLLDLTIQNYLIGHRAGESMTDGVENCFLGLESGVFNTTGTSNVFIGQNSGYANLNGHNNTFIGTKAGRWSRVGHNNTFIGALTGDEQVNGDNNVYIGGHAGAKKSEGFENVFIGCNAGENNQNGSNNIFIGHSAGYFETGGEKLIIDSYARDSSGALIYGDLFNGNLRINNRLGVGMNAETDYALAVNGDALKEGDANWDVTSDQRVKSDIRTIEKGLEQIMKLRPVTFRFNDEWKESHPALKDKYYYSFIAQEFAEVFPASVIQGSERLESDPEALYRMNSQPAQVVAIRAIQELAEQNRKQQETIDRLIDKVEALEAELTNSR